MTSANRMIARRSTDPTDDFPTPPWATLALLEYILPLPAKTKVWEPAAGRGHMTKALRRAGLNVFESDSKDYGQGYPLLDFTYHPNLKRRTDWVITNPPYSKAHAFYESSMHVAREGVALLVRLNWLQGAGRWRTIFNDNPPVVVGIFASRMPATQGKIVQKASVFFQHCWVVWDAHHKNSDTRLVWIPPDAQQRLEHPKDYL